MAVITGNENIAKFLGAANAPMPFSITSGQGAFMQDPLLYGAMTRQQSLYDDLIRKQQEQQANQPGFFQNLISGLADPFVRLGGVGAVGINKLLGNEDYSKQLQTDIFGEDSNLLLEGLKGGAGVASWLVPGVGAAGTVGNLASRGAFAGMLGALSTEDYKDGSLDIGNILKGGAIGGGIGGAFGLAGKGLRAMSGAPTQQASMLDSFDDALSKQIKLVKQASAAGQGSGFTQGFDVAKQLGATGKLGDVNPIVNYLNNPKIQEKFAQAGFVTTPAQKAQLAAELLAKRGDKLPQGFITDQLKKLAGSANTGVVGIGGFADDISKVPTEKLQAFRDQTFNANNAFLGGTPGSVYDRGGVSSMLQSIDDELAKRTTGVGEKLTLGQRLTKHADNQILGQFKRELGTPSKALGSVSLYDDAQKVLVDGKTPLLRFGDSADDVLAKSQEILNTQGRQIANVTDDLANKGVMVDMGEVRNNLVKSMNAVQTPQMKEPFAKVLSTLDSVTPGGGQVNFADVSKVLSKSMPGRNTDAFILAMQQRANGAVGATADDVAFMLKDMGVASNVADDIGNQLAAQSRAVPINQFYQLKQEIGKLGKWNQFTPPADTQAAKAFNKAYITMNDTLDNALQKNGFGAFREINKNVAVATKMQNHMSGRVASQAGMKPLGFGEFIGGFGGFSLTGGNPLGALGGIAMSKFQRSDIPQRLFIGAEKGLGNLLSGAKTPEILSKLGGKLGPAVSKLAQTVSTPQALQLGTSIAAPTAVRMGQPDQLALNNIISAQGGGGDVLGASTGATAPVEEQMTIDPNTGMPTTAPSGMGGGMPSLGGGMPGMGGGGGMNPNGITFMQLFEAALADTGDFNTAMRLTEFLAPQLGIGQGGGMGGNKVDKDVAGFQLAEGLINEAEAMSGELGLGDSSVLQKLTSPFRQLGASMGLDSSYYEYEQQKEGLTARIARAMGETGPLTDVDIQRYSKMLPSLGDTQEQAARKIQMLRARLQRAQQVYGGQQFMQQEEPMYDESMLASAYY